MKNTDKLSRLVRVFTQGHLVRIFHAVWMMVLLLIFSCGRKHQETERVENEPMVELTSAQVMIDAAQAEAIGLKMGSLEQRNLTNVIKANGYVEVPPQNMAVISPFISGYIKEVRYLVGDQVRKGHVVAILESPDYLQIQQRYIELDARLQYLQDAFNRQETLLKENAVSKKKYLEAQVAYKTALSVYNGLIEQLKLLGADFDALKQGQVTPLVFVRSPIGGSVSAVNAAIGRHVETREEIFEIIDSEHLHLELSVFERDILKVQKDQKVIFSVPNMGGKTYTGKVYLVGRNMDDDRRYISVHVHLDDDSAPCVVGMYVNASIVIDDELVYAIPAQAVMVQGAEEFVFVERNGSGDQKVFQKVRVITGTKDQDYVELKQSEGVRPEDRVVVDGAFYLMNAFQGGGE
jgi:cobalt-zinc-cadmium efflux system membrane fusion protein